MLLINVREYRRGFQNGQSRETGNIGHTRRRQTKQKHNTVCVGHHYTERSTNIIILNEIRFMTFFYKCMFYTLAIL